MKIVVEELKDFAALVDFGSSFSRQTLNLFQDVAKAKALQELAAQYMKKFGHNDVELFLGFEDWVAAFPPDWAQA
jgi:glutamate mutase epsilon subunit